MAVFLFIFESDNPKELALFTDGFLLTNDYFRAPLFKSNK